MADKEPMPASDDGANKGRQEGVTDPGGRGGASESSGSAYPNPHTGKDGAGGAGGFTGHGGQTEIGYHGGGQAGAEGPETANATTRGGAGESGGGGVDGDDADGDDAGQKAPPQDRIVEQTRTEEMEGRTVQVFETSGVAAAQAKGTTGAEGQEKTSPEHPGGG